MEGSLPELSQRRITRRRGLEQASGRRRKLALGSSAVMLRRNITPQSREPGCIAVMRRAKLPELIQPVMVFKICAQRFRNAIAMHLVRMRDTPVSDQPACCAGAAFTRKLWAHLCHDQKADAMDCLEHHHEPGLKFRKRPDLGNHHGE